MNRIVYLNTKTNLGTETVDYLQRNDFSTYKDFLIELRRLKKEYHLAGINVYTSQRSVKNYFN